MEFKNPNLKMSDYRTVAAANILVVDDNPDNLYLLDCFLTNKGYVVRTVCESRLALEAVWAEIPDLVLLDIMMPSPDGWEICRQLKANDLTRDLPVIFLSAKSEVLDKIKAFAGGGVDYITKPFQFEEVLLRVENQLKISRLQKQLAQQNARLSEEIRDRELAEIALERQLSRSNLLRVITEQIRSHIEPEQIFETAAAVVGKAFGSSRAQILFYTELPTAQLPIAGEYLAKGCAAIKVAEIPVAGNPHAQQVLSQEGAIATNDITREPLLKPVQPLYFKLGSKSLLSVRTSYKGKPNGAIALHQCDRKRKWEPEEIELLEAIAAQLGIAIAQAKLLEQEQLARAEQHRQNLQLQQEIRHRLSVEIALTESENKYRTLVEASADAIFMVTPETNLICDCNQRAVEMFEAESKAELLNIQGHTLHSQTYPPEALSSSDEVIANNGFLSLEIEYRTKRGKLFWGDLAAKLIYVGGQKIHLIRIADISERKHREEALKLIVAGTASSTGSEFLRRCVRYLAEVLQVRYSFITEIVNPAQTRARTLAFWHGLDWSENIEYEIAGTPCEKVSEGQECYSENGVQQIFPKARYLAQLNIESYWGIPLINSERKVIGHLAVLDEKPIAKDARIEAILKIFAARAAAELERKQAESELRSAKERLQHLLATSPAVIYNVKPSVSGKLAFLTDNVTALVGWQAEEFLEDGKFWASRLHPEDAEGVFARLPLLLSKGEDSCEYRFLHKDGAYRWLYDRIRLVKDEAGNPIESVGYWVDISDRKLAESALQEMAQREKAIVSIIQKMRQTLDFENIFNAVAVELRQAIKCDRTAVFRFNPDWSGNFVAESAAPGWISVLREQKGEPHLREGYLDPENLPMKTLVNNFERVADTYLEETNGRANFYITNFRVVEDIYSAGFAPCHVKLLEQFQARAYVIVPIFCGQKLWGLLATYQNSGPRIWSEAEINMIVQIGTQLGVALQQAELLAQTQKQSAALQQAAIAADAANRAKTEFLAAMSHELRTPLNAILGFTQIMSHDRSLNQQQQENLGIINRAGEHLLNLINDILEMSKIEAGQTELNLSSFDLIGLLLSLEEMLRLKAQSKGLQLIFDIAPDIPQYVQADEGKLRQILINILGNAIKFTQKGRVELRVQRILGNHEDSFQSLTSNVPTSLSSVQLFFEVKDTGSGISPVEIDQLFETFTQTETGRKSQQGTGLGLPISQKFVQLMGGNIAGRSILGQGTVFTFDIPITLAEERDIPTSQPQQKIIGLAPDQPKYRILVVEDRYENRLLLVALLRAIGFEVCEAENGREAIELWFNWEPHLIWMDMRMPVMDGYEATKHIKAHLKGQKTAIIAITASAFEEERSLFLSAGCDDVVRKPFRDKDILEMMAKHLEVRYIYEEHPEANDPLLSGKEILEIGEFLTPQALASMPENWLEELQQAATELDEKQIFILLDQIQAEYPQIVSGLEDLVNNFRFDLIIDLIREELP